MAKHLQIIQLIKSKYFSKKTNLLCLADDSGLEIDILKKHLAFIQLDGVEKNLDFKKQSNVFIKNLIKKIKIGKIKK